MRALVRRRPWIDKILEGEKIWEIRGSRTSVRGQVGLIASRSGTVVGICDLVDCLGPLGARARNYAGRNSRDAAVWQGGYRAFARVLSDKPVPVQKLPMPSKFKRGDDLSPWEDPHIVWN